MLHWTLTFFILTLTAGILGFAGLVGLSGPVTSTAQVLFGVFLVGFVISLIAGHKPVTV